MAFWCVFGLFNMWLAGLLAFHGDSDARTAFNTVYGTEQWGDAGGGSGSGSTLEFTRPTRHVLLSLLTKLEAGSMIDAPCGAMVWTAPFLREDVPPVIPGFRYLGVDVVDSVMAANKQRFAAEKTWSFEHVDLSATVLPNGYDVIFSRDAFQHMPMEAVVQILRMMSQTDAKWLIAGSYDNGYNHRTTWGGPWYAIDLRKAPFNLDGNAEAVHEGGDKTFLVYNIQDYLRTVDFDQMAARERAYWSLRSGQCWAIALTLTAVLLLVWQRTTSGTNDSNRKNNPLCSLLFVCSWEEGLSCSTQQLHHPVSNPEGAEGGAAHGI